MRTILKTHDMLTLASAWLAAAGIGVIAFSYCYEVVSRYFFNAPTNWVGAITTYLLLACTMMMAPYVTQARSHVTITFLLERFGEQKARYLLAACVAVSAIVCLLSVWFTGTETWRQYLAGTTIVDSLMLTPKWQLSAFIVYGFLSSGLYFLRLIPATLSGASGTPSSSFGME